MADFNYTGGVRFARDIVVDVTADKDGNPTKACNPITGVCLEGGGGESDFSTAEVRVLDTDNTPMAMNGLPVIISDEEMSIEGSTGYSPAVTPEGVYSVILYKGKCYLYENPNDVSETSGAIEYSDDLRVYIITGDCSIILYGSE